jgi:putative transposase
MQRDVPFQDFELFHIYNRGTNKMQIFDHGTDYARFQQLLFLVNQIDPIHISNLSEDEKLPKNLYARERSKSLVSIFAYSLMPNHFHIVLRQNQEKGISQFMQKLTTGYSMYYNKSRKRTGTLFQGKFKSKHIADDEYMRHIFSYVHLNHAEIAFPGWKVSKPIPKNEIITYILKQQHASAIDYFGNDRPQKEIITIDKSLPWFETIQKPEDMFAFYEDKQQG